MRLYWQFLVVTTASLSIELAPALGRTSAFTAIALGIIVAVFVIRRAQIALKK
jgi:hypothetical protein